MIASINSYFERQIGTSAISSTRRSQVMTEQAETVLQTLPGMTIGAIFIVSMVLFHAWNGPLFIPLLAWALSVTVLQGMGFRTWLRSLNG